MEKPDTTECKFCNTHTPEQWAQLATPSYKIKKEKCEARKQETTSTPIKDNSWIHPLYLLLGQLTIRVQPSSHVEPPEKKVRKDKPSTSKAKAKPENKSSTDSKIADQKWSDRFSHIEALLMGWSHVQDMDNSTNISEDNPFAGPKAAVPGKVSVQMSTEDWLCRKLSKLNITLVEGYPSRSSEAGGLLKDQFLRPAKSQAKWYGLFSDQKVDPSALSSWNTDASKLNSSYSRIAIQAGLSSTPPASHISRDTAKMGEVGKGGYC